MTKTSEKEKERTRKAARLLYDAAHRIRILRSIDWPAPVKQGLFASGPRELPQVSYKGFDATPVIDIVREARRIIIPISPIELWLERQANSIEAGARMLAGVGTPVFFEFARQGLRGTDRTAALPSLHLAGTRPERSRRHRSTRPCRPGRGAIRPSFRRGRRAGDWRGSEAAFRRRRTRGDAGGDALCQRPGNGRPNPRAARCALHRPGCGAAAQPRGLYPRRHLAQRPRTDRPADPGCAKAGAGGWKAEFSHELIEYGL
jgi:hypothetical protein